MRIVVGVLGGALVALMLFEIFLAFLLPRRVKRDPLLARRVAIYAFRPWRALARRLPDEVGDTLLGMYGPFGLLLDLGLWVVLLMFGYACLQWAGGSHLRAGPGVDFGQDLYFSAATLVSSGTAGLAVARHLRARRAGHRRGHRPRGADDRDRLPAVALPGLLAPRDDRLAARRARRLAAVGRPARRARDQRGGWAALNDYLSGWEVWSAELMETHLSYPTLAYFRSQHVNQNWLSALCTILDASALAVCAAPEGTVEEARFTFAISRHAIADLSYTFRTKPRADTLVDRLPRGGLRGPIAEVSSTGVPLRDSPEAIRERLERLRRLYEPYAEVLAERVELRLPPWLAPESPTDNWRTTAWH